MPGAIVSPRAAERAPRRRSPGCGAWIEPPEAVFTYRRFKLPDTQRTPCPKTRPPAASELPCKTTLVALGRSPLVVNSTLSYESRAMPLAASDAPPVLELLSQPRPGAAGGLPQGQA